MRTSNVVPIKEKETELRETLKLAGQDLVSHELYRMRKRKMLKMT